MAEPVDWPAFGSPEDEIDEADEDRSVTELLEPLGRELGVVVLLEAQLGTSRNAPDVKRGAAVVLAPSSPRSRFSPHSRSSTLRS